MSEVENEIPEVTDKEVQTKSDENVSMKEEKPESKDKENTGLPKNTVIAVIVIAVALALFMFFQGNSTNPATNTVIDPANTQGANGDNIVDAGEMVLINYIGYLTNGTIFDTSFEQVAKDNLVYQPLRPYEAFPVTVGAGELIEGFEEALVGMSKGQTKNVTIPPEKAYGYRTEDLVESVPIVQTSPRIQDVGIEKFRNEIKKEPEVGMVFSVPTEDPAIVGWPMEILSIQNETITFEYNPEPGTSISTIFGESTVTVNETDILITHSPHLGPILTVQGPAQVIQIDEEKIIVDFNMELAGKTLIFQITVEDIQ